MQGTWIFLFLIVIICIVIPTRNRIILNKISRKKKGIRRKMPFEMIKDFIGKECSISLFNEVGAVKGIILSVEENWIKVEESKKIRIINGDMIRDISFSKVQK